MNTRGAVHLAATVLVLHQRMNDGGPCRCGWNELGKSHAEHQAQQLQASGLLR